MHLDGKGYGQLFARYFREMGTAVREVAKYRAAIEEFKKQPGVESFPDGSFRWRGDLKPPQRPAVLESDELSSLPPQPASMAIATSGKARR